MRLTVVVAVGFAAYALFCEGSAEMNGLEAAARPYAECERDGVWFEVSQFPGAFVKEVFGCVVGQPVAGKPFGYAFSIGNKSVAGTVLLFFCVCF